MKIGDRVKVRQQFMQANKKCCVWNPVWQPIYGTIVFMSSKWATVMLDSRKTGKPIYRESFLLRDISVVPN